jgi:anti-anti-sigma factor
MDGLSVEVGRLDGGRVLVTVGGELDLAGADRLWKSVEDLFEPGTTVVLDGTGLVFLDSTGLRVLIRAAQLAAAEGAGFRFVAPHPAVQRVLELSGTSGLLGVQASMEAALGA